MERTHAHFISPPINNANDKRLLFITGLAAIIGICAGFISQIVTTMIGFVTNLSFYGELSGRFSSPADNRLGLLVIGIPVVGGIIVGFMARYGSKAIRGHGIPETMEQVLLNQSRIPPRITILKPLSAAVSIGTGGPFGAEGPIIATGGAVGSLFGQFIKTTADERKALLAAGAAAGMAAIFGSPVSAVLLAIELLLFEFRSRSFIPVAIAAVAATAIRILFEGLKPVFAMPILPTPTEGAIAMYVLIGAVIGLVSVWLTRAVYWIEDRFEKLEHSRLNIHWMWWPAIGGVVVGVIGYFVPRTMGVGYDNISGFLNGSFTTEALLLLCVFKFLSWSIALGSGTSGGTLAPLFTIGGALGAAMAVGVHLLFPDISIDPRMAGLIGMAAMFAGASRALLASVVFAFETTQQSSGLLPLLGGCSAAYLISDHADETYHHDRKNRAARITGSIGLRRRSSCTDTRPRWTFAAGSYAACRADGRGCSCMVPCARAGFAARRVSRARRAGRTCRCGFAKRYFLGRPATGANDRLDHSSRACRCLRGQHAPRSCGSDGHGKSRPIACCFA